MRDRSFDDPENSKTSKMEEANKLSFLPFLFFHQTLFLPSPSLHVLTIYLHLIPTFYAKPSRPHLLLLLPTKSLFLRSLPSVNLVDANT